jgi:hypothetical protein
VGCVPTKDGKEVAMGEIRFKASLQNHGLRLSSIYRIFDGTPAQMAGCNPLNPITNPQLMFTRPDVINAAVIVAPAAITAAAMATPRVDMEDPPEGQRSSHC